MICKNKEDLDCAVNAIACSDCVVFLMKVGLLD